MHSSTKNQLFKSGKANVTFWKRIKALLGFQSRNWFTEIFYPFQSSTRTWQRMKFGLYKHLTAGNNVFTMLPVAIKCCEKLRLLLTSQYSVATFYKRVVVTCETSCNVQQASNFTYNTTLLWDKLRLCGNTYNKRATLLTTQPCCETSCNCVLIRTTSEQLYLQLQHVVRQVARV